MRSNEQLSGQTMQPLHFCAKPLKRSAGHTPLPHEAQRRNARMRALEQAKLRCARNFRAAKQSSRKRAH